MLKKSKRILSLILVAAMLLSMAVFSVSAETTTETLVATKVYASKKGDYTTLIDESSSISVKRNKRQTYFVFEDVEFISAMSDIFFTVAGKVGIQNKKMTVYKISGDIPESTAVSDWQAVWTTVASNIEALKENPLKYKISKLDIADGDTIILYFPDCDDDPGIGSLNHSTFPPKITYSIDREAFTASVLEKVNTAKTAEELTAVLNTYKNTIGIADEISDEISDVVTGRILKNKTDNFTSLEEIATAYTNALNANLETVTVSPVVIGRVNSAGGGNVTSSETISQAWSNGNGHGNLYYIFNEIEDWSALQDAVFTVYRSAESTKDLYVYAVDESFDVDGFTASADKETFLKDYVAKEQRTIMTSVDTYDSENQILSLNLSTVKGMKDGYSLVIYFYNTSTKSETMGGCSHETNPPVITCKLDREVLTASVLKKVNTAETLEEFTAVLNTYKNTIGIADTYTLALSAEIISYFAETMLSTEYTDLETVKADFEANYQEVMDYILAIVNDTETTKGDLADHFAEFKTAIGISDLVDTATESNVNENIAQYVINIRPERGYADFEAVKTAYQAGYDAEYVSNSVLQDINEATDGEVLASLLEINADLIGIDFSRYAYATEEINNALLIETDFESLEAVKEAYNNAYYSVITEKNVLADVIYSRCSNGFKKVTSVANLDRGYGMNGHLYYVFNDIEWAGANSTLKFTVGDSSTHSEDVTVYVLNDTVPSNLSTMDELTAYMNNKASSRAITKETVAAGVADGILTINLSDIAVEDGQTLLLYFKNTGGKIGGNGHANPPTVTGTINQTAFNESVLSKINKATAETIETLLSAYSETIGYDLSRYTTVKEAVHTAILNKEADYTSLEEVAEAVNSAYYEKYTRISVMPDETFYEKDKAFGTIPNTAPEINQAWGEKGHVYYCFENVEDASLINNSVFTVYRSAEHSDNVNIYTGVDTDVLNAFSTVADKVAYIKNCTNKSLKSVRSYDNTNKVVTLLLSDLDLKDGDSFVIYFHNDGDSAKIGGNAHEAYPPLVSFDKDEEAFNAKVLGLINTATLENIEAVATKYIETLGIDAEKYAFAKTAINPALVGQNFETIEDVTIAYNNAYKTYYDEVYIEKQAYVDVIYGYGSNNAKQSPKTVSNCTEANNIDRNYGMAGKLWYVFNDIEWVEHSSKMTFSVGNNSSQKNPTTGAKVNLVVYALNTEVSESLTTKEELDAAVASDKRIATATISSEDIATFTVNGFLTVEIPIELTGAKSIVMYFDDTSGTINGAGCGVSPVYRPTLTFDVNEVTIEAEILSSILNAEDDAEIRAILKAYEETLMIDSQKLSYIKDDLKDIFVDITYEDIKPLFTILVEASDDIWESHTVNVTNDSRQSFKGFGYTNSGFTLSGSSVKDEILTKAIDELNMRSVKLWVEIGKCVSEDENGNITVDASSYISELTSEENGYAYANDHGIKDFVFGPTVRLYDLPQSYVNENGKVLPEMADEYGVLLADIIKQFIDKGINITTTTIINESQAGLIKSIDTDEDGMADDNAYLIANAIIALRAKLDSYGLNDIKIAAPEIANVDDGHTSFYNNMKEKHPDAYKLIDVWAIHSYNMSLTSSFGNVLWYDDKEVISLESCNTGGADYNDESVAATNAARALNDINNGVTQWTHFHNMGNGGDSTSLVHYYNSTNTYALTSSYDYLKALSNSFTEGTVIRKTTVDGNSVSYTYDSRKPLINTASGVDKNGNWVISLVNGSDNEKSYLDKGFRTLPDTYATVTLTVEELKDVASKTFTVYSSRKDNEIREIILKNGTATLNLYPRELIVLTEKTDDTAKVIYSVEKDGKTYSRINASGAMTGILGEYSGSKLNDVTFYNMSEGTNVIEKCLKEGTDNASVMVFDAISTMKPNMDKFSVYSLQ